MAIHNNLQQLRLSIGLTQEQVAEKLSVTRQTVSSYESGRTRPDIDTLIRLSEIYGTDLEGIVYGSTHKLKSIRTIKITSFITLVLTIFLILISSVLRWSSNYFFPLLNNPDLQFLQQHVQLSNASDLAEGLALTVSFLLFIVLLLLVLIQKCKILFKTKLLYILFFIILLFAASLPFGIADPIFGIMNYCLVPISISVRITVFFIIEITVTAIRSKRT